VTATGGLLLIAVGGATPDAPLPAAAVTLTAQRPFIRMTFTGTMAGDASLSLAAPGLALPPILDVTFTEAAP
jgi:hypothetical protein